MYRYRVGISATFRHLHREIVDIHLQGLVARNKLVYIRLHTLGLGHHGLTRVSPIEVGKDTDITNLVGLLVQLQSP